SGEIFLNPCRRRRCGCREAKLSRPSPLHARRGEGALRGGPPRGPGAGDDGKGSRAAYRRRRGGRGCPSRPRAAGDRSAPGRGAGQIAVAGAAGGGAHTGRRVTAENIRETAFVWTRISASRELGSTLPLVGRA